MLTMAFVVNARSLHCTIIRQVAALEAELADAEENAKIAHNKYRKEVNIIKL